MDSTSRYIVGIDLGTTNCALAYTDTSAADTGVEVFRIPQLIAPGEMAELPCLPSFIYLPEEGDEVAETLRLPWHLRSPGCVVGTAAREQASRTPGKVVSSAKSWLCCESVDRRSACLPWDRTAIPRRISPVEASRLLLEHLREAWNWKMAGDDPALRLEHQEILLTVPASFDAVARQLTVEAAEGAGLSVRLFEEPQAAFYAWLHARGDGWRDDVAHGDTILVCDIGGGTTDFSLIAVEDTEGDLELRRLAVGDHTLLGGDNMDLALAYGMAEKLRRTQGVQVDAYRLAALTHACRSAKEIIGDGDPGPVPVTILGRGSGVVGGTVTTELTRDELQALLLDGFLPVCDPGDRPAERRKVGLRTFGLDYAADPALTRHLAAFITRHGVRDEEGAVYFPTAMLFNGGVTRSALFRQRILDVIRGWMSTDDAGIRTLETGEPDLAVALGAAWYGRARRHGGVRIRAGSPRSYYVGVESSLPAVPGFAPPVEALCVVSFGMEEGTSASVDAADLGLVVGEPTEFRFYTSTCRPADRVGDRLGAWDPGEIEELSPLVAELPAGEGESSAIGTVVPVGITSELNEIGTVSLACRDLRGAGSWRLEFELRVDEEGSASS